MTTREKYLMHIGVAPHLKGFRLLARATEIYQDDPYMLITKELYPRLAEEFGTTASRVERAIRHEIDHAVDCCADGGIWKLTGNITPLGKDHPSNGTTIAALALLSDEEMLREMEEDA